MEAFKIEIDVTMHVVLARSGNNTETIDQLTAEQLYLLELSREAPAGACDRLRDLYQPVARTF